MPAYLVRQTTKGPSGRANEIVGVFFASTLDSLRWLIDEHTDTDLCEYAELPDGCIAWAGPTTFTVPAPKAKEYDDLPEIPWGEADIGEEWIPCFYNVSYEKNPLVWVSLAGDVMSKPAVGTA